MIPHSGVLSSKSQLKSSEEEDAISLSLKSFLGIVVVNGGLGGEVVVVVGMIAVVEVVVVVLEVGERLFGGFVGDILGAKTGTVEVESEIQRLYNL